jgi:hypothetical protein
VPTATPTGDLTVHQWAQAVLTRLGVPVTPANVTAMVAWAAAEGGNWHNTAHYNPLGTTLREPGSTSMNSVGVQSYVSWDSGISATVSMLNQSNMAGIKRALSKGNDPEGVVTAVLSSPWGTQTIALSNGKTYNPTGGAHGGYTGAGSGRDYTPTGPGASYSDSQPKADDWLSTLDKALNPKTNKTFDILGDTAGAIQLVAVRAGVAIVGMMFLGTGLLLMFGREIFGAAMMAIPGVGEAGAASKVATSVAKHV